MKKASTALAFLLAATLASAGPAFGWGSATHAYIGHELRAQAGPVDLDEVYGSMAPDLFNFIFASPDYPQLAPLVPYLYALTHYDQAGLNDSLRRGWEKASLYGFLGHSEARGSDRTAHVASLTLDPAEGYVIAKAQALNQLLMQDPRYAALVALGLTPQASLDICHNLVESAGDLIVAQASPNVGGLMAASAARPAQPLEGLLLRAWTPGLVAAGLTQEQAAGLIVGWDTWFRGRMIAYGGVMQLPPADAFAGVVQDFATLAQAYLLSLGVTLPPGSDLAPLIADGLAAAVALCQGDYLDEVEKTVGYTAFQLKRSKALQPLR
ncbi:MAG TPA: hypothetical protein VI078_14590 [bacterium]